jgi:hypothetical protein
MQKLSRPAGVEELDVRPRRRNGRFQHHTIRLGSMNGSARLLRWQKCQQLDSWTYLARRLRELLDYLCMVRRLIPKAITSPCTYPECRYYASHHYPILTALD